VSTVGFFVSYWGLYFAMKNPAFLFYVGDFNDGTQDFTNEEVGAYLRMLLFQFSQGHLPMDRIKRKLGADFEKLWPIISTKFMTDSDGNYYNERLQSEIDKRTSFSESRRKNISARYNKDKNNTSATYVEHMENEIENDNELDNNKEKEVIVKKEKFEIFWNLYCYKTGRKHVEAKWMKLPIETMELIIQRVPAYVKSTPDVKYRKQPLTYLNGEHWNDEVSKTNEQISADGKIFIPTFNVYISPNERAAWQKNWIGRLITSGIDLNDQKELSSWLVSNERTLSDIPMMKDHLQTFKDYFNVQA
jgi:uncharacterized protein YdaU (DUF1376 family)